MLNFPTKDTDCQQDTLERVNNWISVLERRIHALLEMNDPESMKPAEREQAASHHLMLLLDFLKLRQNSAMPSDMGDQRALADAYLAMEAATAIEAAAAMKAAKQVKDAG